MLRKLTRLLLIALLVGPISAQAAAIYSANAELAVSAAIISTSSSAFVLAKATNFDLDANANGDAFTYASTTAADQEVDLLTATLTLTAVAGGEVGPGIGDGESLSLNNLSIFVSNPGNSEVTVRLNIVWSQAVDASTDSLGETADAFSKLLLTSSLSGIPPLIDDLLSASASAGTEETDSSGGSRFVDFVVASGDTVVLLGLVDAFGSAQSTVPEPTSLALLGLGLAGLAATRRRKQ